MNQEEQNFKLTTILSTLIIVGLIGNILNLVVFSNKSMRKISTYKYLYHLSFLHILILAVSATDTLFKFGLNIDIRLYSKLTCRIHMYFISFLNHLSSLVFIFIILDRILEIFLSSINKNLIYKSMILSSAFIAILNTHYLLFLDLNLIKVTEININVTINNLEMIPNDQTEIALLRYAISKDKIMFESERNSSVNSNESTKLIHHHHYICHPLNGTQYNNFLIFAWNWIDSILYSFLPVIVIVLSSLILIFRYKDIKHKIKEKDLLVLLIVLSVYFIFTSLSYSLVTNIKLKKEKTETNWILLFVKIVSHSSSSINFLFYLFILENYRKIIINFVKKSILKISNDGESLLINSNNNTSQCNHHDINDGNSFAMNPIAETQL